MGEDKSDALRFLERISGGPLTFASMLWSIRRCDELSMDEFAVILGVTRSDVVEVEAGRKRVSDECAAEWARVLGYGEEHFVRLARLARDRCGGNK